MERNNTVRLETRDLLCPALSKRKSKLGVFRFLGMQETDVKICMSQLYYTFLNMNKDAMLIENLKVDSIGKTQCHLIMYVPTTLHIPKYGHRCHARGKSKIRL